MSTLCGKLCALILKEHFGDDVEKIGKILFASGQLPLKGFNSNESCTRKSVRTSLCVLIQYGLASHGPGKSGTTLEYRLKREKVLRFLRYPKYLMMTKKLYGKESEVMIEELLRRGRVSVSNVILRAYTRLIADQTLVEVDRALIQRLRDEFEVLVNKQYVERLLDSQEAADSAVRFAPPRVELVSLIAVVASGRPDPTESVYWTINHARFHQDMRDEILVGAISRRINQHAGDVFRLMLRQAYLLSPANVACSNTVALSQLRELARKAKVDVKHFEDYLAVIAEDASAFLSKDSLSQGAAYMVNMQRAVEELTWNVLASAVEVRHGVGAARIFRLVREEEYIEQDEIQKRAMLPDKECKLLTYTLVQGGWLQQQELRKGLQKGGPTKTFYLFCIDLGQAVRMLIECCYRSLGNCVARREHASTTHAALLDKQQRIQAITHQLQLRGADPLDIAEIAELITPPEASLLEQIHGTINKLQQAELEIDSTLFILEMYLEFRT